MAAELLHASSGCTLFFKGIGHGSSIRLRNSLSDPTNQIELDSSGDGTMTVLLRNPYRRQDWRAVLLYHNRVGLPISQHGDGSLRTQTGFVAAADLVPHTPWPASDFNSDGVLEFTSDYAAFLAGYAAHVSLADINFDGAWMQADIDEWTASFWEDEAHQP